MVAGARLELLRGGAGAPVLMLHDELGPNGPRRYHEAMARGRTVLAPSLPGYRGSLRLDWVMTMRDLAQWTLLALDGLGLGAVPVIGVSLGGWLAAAMAAMRPDRVGRLVLVGAMGIRAPAGDILDRFLVTAKPFLDAGFLAPAALPEHAEISPANPSPEQREAWEVAREQSARLGWKPYMFDPALPHLLRPINVPSLVVWGREDAVVPLSAVEAYRDALAGSRLEVLAQCGHHPEVEQRGQFLALVEPLLVGA